MSDAAMKGLLLVSAVAVALASGGHAARAENYPWCAVYNTGDAAYNCGFVSYEQCQATVSGIGGFCERNTLYRPEPPMARRHRPAYRS